MNPYQVENHGAAFTPIKLRQPCWVGGWAILGGVLGVALPIASSTIAYYVSMIDAEPLPPNVGHCGTGALALFLLMPVFVVFGSSVAAMAAATYNYFAD